MKRKDIDSIFLSSTDYDQGDFRDSLADQLSQYGYSTFNFKNAVNSLDPKLHSTEECLKMIDKVDCLVGIIGERFGNPYSARKTEILLSKLPGCPRELSATQAEIIYARVKKRIPTIIIVRKGVWDKRKSNTLDPRVAAFLDYINRQPQNNYLHIDIESSKDAFRLITQRTPLIPRKRLNILGAAMEGDEWNGRLFFKNKEVTIVNKEKDGYEALEDLLAMDDNIEDETNRLKWIIKLFSDDDLGEKDLEFLIQYSKIYTGRKQSNIEPQERATIDEKAIKLLDRMQFGNHKVFGGYRHSSNGGSPQPLRWPRDAKDWSAFARLEFILYSMKLENKLPVNLRRMIEFSAAHNNETGEGFVAHYSRKPSTVGCANACAVRLIKDAGERGIDENFEMKSMLYLANLSHRYILVAVHGEGDKVVSEGLVLKELINQFGGIDTKNVSIAKLPEVVPENLVSYLRKTRSAQPKNGIKANRRLSMNGAQELIGLYASAINPVSVLKSVEYKVAFIHKHTEVDTFDVLMLWDEGIYEYNQCYNNAGSPTWGVRFNPKEMYLHVELNSKALESRMKKDKISFNFKIKKGVFMKSK